MVIFRRVRTRVSGVHDETMVSGFAFWQKALWIAQIGGVAMKKILCYAFLIVVASVFICGSSKATAADRGNYKIRLAHVEPEERSLHKCCLDFKNYVEDRSGGKIIVEVYPNAQLGGDRQALETVSLGALEMTAAASAVLSNYDPSFGILDLPFIFKDREATVHACDGKVGQILNSKLPAFGIVGLGFSDYGQRHITNNVRPIHEPKDLKGIKMRVMENPVYVDLFRTLGANPTPMSFGELYTALQQGTVDGQENPPPLIYASKFYEVQKYLSLTGHTWNFNVIAISKAFFDSLPEELRTIVVDGARTQIVEQERVIEAQIQEEYVVKLEQEGMIVNEITPENRQKFVEATQPVRDKYLKGFSEELLLAMDEANQ